MAVNPSNDIPPQTTRPAHSDDISLSLAEASACVRIIVDRLSEKTGLYGEGHSGVGFDVFNDIVTEEYGHLPIGEVYSLFTERLSTRSSANIHRTKCVIDALSWKVPASLVSILLHSDPKLLSDSRQLLRAVEEEERLLVIGLVAVINAKYFPTVDLSGLAFRTVHELKWGIDTTGGELTDWSTYWAWIGRMSVNTILGRLTEKSWDYVLWHYAADNPTHQSIYSKYGQMAAIPTVGYSSILESLFNRNSMDNTG